MARQRAKVSSPAAWAAGNAAEMASASNLVCIRSSPWSSAPLCPGQIAKGVSLLRTRCVAKTQHTNEMLLDCSQSRRYYPIRVRIPSPREQRSRRAGHEPSRIAHQKPTWGTNESWKEQAFHV